MTESRSFLVRYRRTYVLNNINLLKPLEHRREKMSNSQVPISKKDQLLEP